jgi:hypothetical protein
MRDRDFFRLRIFVSLRNYTNFSLLLVFCRLEACGTYRRHLAGLVQKTN